MATLLRRTSSDLASMSRASQRKKRLQQIENEQRIEEAEALVMTEEQRETLSRSFTSVKVEFSDLDGLKWTHSALRMLQAAPHSPPSTAPIPNGTGRDQAFVVLTNADLATFSPEDTIRASAARLRPRFPALSHANSSPNLGRITRSNSSVRSHSPLKGPGSDTHYAESRNQEIYNDGTGYESDCDRTVRGGCDSDSDGGAFGVIAGRCKKGPKKNRKRTNKSMTRDGG